VAINGQTAATIVHTDDYTGYVSPYFVIGKGKLPQKMSFEPLELTSCVADLL